MYHLFTFKQTPHKLSNNNEFLRFVMIQKKIYKVLKLNSIMNKKGLIGKIFLIIIIIILLIGAVMGVTAYQAYHLYKTAEQEKIGIEEDIKILSEQKNCTKVDSIQTRFLKIKSEAGSACKNPLIKLGIKKFISNNPIKLGEQSISLSCENLNTIYEEMTKQLQPIKEMCNNINSNTVQ